MLEYEKTLDMIFARWKSQILYAGVKLGKFETLSQEPKDASDISKENGLDEASTFRLLRALASLGFLKEALCKRFSIRLQGW